MEIMKVARGSGYGATPGARTSSAWMRLLGKAVIFATVTTEFSKPGIWNNPAVPATSRNQQSHALRTLPMNGFADHQLDESAFGEKKTFTDGLRTFDAFRKWN